MTHVDRKVAGRQHSGWQDIGKLNRLMHAGPRGTGFRRAGRQDLRGWTERQAGLRWTGIRQVRRSQAARHYLTGRAQSGRIHSGRTRESTLDSGGQDSGMQPGLRRAGLGEADTTQAAKTRTCRQDSGSQTGLRRASLWHLGGLTQTDHKQKSGRKDSSVQDSGMN